MINRLSESFLMLRLHAQNVPKLFRLATSSSGTGRTQLAEVPDELMTHHVVLLAKRGKLSEPLGLHFCNFS